MKHDTNISADRYSGDNALDVLLTDLTSEVAELLAELVECGLYEDWLVVDIQPYFRPGYPYQVIAQPIRGDDNLFFLFGAMILPFGEDYPALTFALDQRLLTESALIHSLHRSHYGHSTTSVIRLCLSEGVRTFRSRRYGFRWDIDDSYLKDMRQTRRSHNVAELARTLTAMGITGEVKWLKADTEEVDIVVDRVIVASLPFDHYPFLGEAILRTDNQKLTGATVDELNTAMKTAREQANDD